MREMAHLPDGHAIPDAPLKNDLALHLAYFGDNLLGPLLCRLRHEVALLSDLAQRVGKSMVPHGGRVRLVRIEHQVGDLSIVAMYLVELCGRF